MIPGLVKYCRVVELENWSVKMNLYEDLLCWAAEQGIELTGIEPQTLSNKGTGIIGTRDIQVPSASMTLKPSLTLLGWRNHSRCPVQNISDSKARPKSYLTKTPPTHITPRPPSRISYS